MKSMGNNIKVVAALVSAVAGVSAADRNGVDINRTGFDALSFAFNVGAEGDTPSGSVKFDYTIEHAPDDGAGAAATYAAVATTDLVVPDWATNVVNSGSGLVLTLDAAAESPCVALVDYIGGKKWVRVVETATGTTNGTPVGVLAILSQPSIAPIAA